MPGLAAALKQRARDAGARLAGIAPAIAPPQAAGLRPWLEAGRHAGMDFMRRDADIRQDIRRWYPQARSVLVCGFAYDGGERPAADAAHGHISRYGAHEDYHRALRLRMEGVLAWLRESCPGADGRIFVDSSPVMEKLYGHQAGLGWIGRNCLLISEEIGSYFLLAGLALNQELETDRPAQDRCGACRRCLDACPSAALGPQRVLDAARCTAYLTIEARGRIPESRRAGMGGWLAGCDLCQDACPWNRGRQDGVLKTLLPLEMPLQEAASVSPEQWGRAFEASPLARLKRPGLIRNALLAMAGSGDAGLAPTLESFTHDPDPVLAEQAAWSLARLPDDA